MESRLKGQCHEMVDPLYFYQSTVLAGESGPQVGMIDEKTGGQKPRDTVPLKGVCREEQFCIFSCLHQQWEIFINVSDLGKIGMRAQHTLSQKPHTIPGYLTEWRGLRYIERKHSGLYTFVRRNSV